MRLEYAYLVFGNNWKLRSYFQESVNRCQDAASSLNIRIKFIALQSFDSLWRQKTISRNN